MIILQTTETSHLSVITLEKQKPIINQKNHCCPPKGSKGTE
jgi:hypothetical protein